MSVTKIKTGSGFVLIEALVASSILSVVLAAGIGAFLLSVRLHFGSTAEVQSAFLAEEGLEALRIMRDNGWTANIASQTASSTFYISFNGSTWVSTASNTYIDGTFERSVVLYDVYRDGGEDITESGTLDPDTKKVTVSVSWRTQSGTSTRSLSIYMTNMFNN